MTHRNILKTALLMAAVGEASTAGASAPAAAPAVPKPASPKLTVVIDGKSQPLLKYPFPVKAAKFPVTVNGEKADAACTAGRGKAYTYILFKNTSFYVPGTLPVDAALTVTFPDGYKFDDAVAPRVSSYKPKKKAATPAAGAATGEGAAADASASASAGGEAGTAANSAYGTASETAQAADATAGAEKAKRRGK